MRDGARGGLAKAIVAVRHPIRTADPKLTPENGLAGERNFWRWSP
jgi:hypothetical protein